MRRITTTISCPILKKCPFVGEDDLGTLWLQFDGDAPELHALAALVNTLAEDPISHEEFTRDVANAVPSASRVVTEWRTGPWHVEVEACST